MKLTKFSNKKGEGFPTPKTPPPWTIEDLKTAVKLTYFIKQETRMRLELIIQCSDKKKKNKIATLKKKKLKCKSPVLLKKL